MEPSDEEDEEAAELGRSSAYVFKALNRIVSSPAAAAAGASSVFNSAQSSRPSDFSQPKSKTKQKSSAASDAPCSANLDRIHHNPQLFPSFLYRLVQLLFCSNLCNDQSSLHLSNIARNKLVNSGLSGLTGGDFKLLYSEQKKISLYDELFENSESVERSMSFGLTAGLQQTNMSFLNNEETDDLMCSPCEDPSGWSHAFCGAPIQKGRMRLVRQV